MKKHNIVLASLLYFTGLFFSETLFAQSAPEGLVAIWGDYTVAPARMTNITRIAAGDDWNLAVAPNGKVLFWGRTNKNGAQPGLLPDTLSSNIVDVAAAWFGLALRNDGKPIAWGVSPYVADGKISADAGLDNVAKIRPGRSGEMWAITSNHAAVAVDSRYIPMCPLPNLSNVEDIAPMALNFDCRSWGYGLILYQNGAVESYGLRNGSPVIVAPEAQGSKAIAAGEYTGLVLKSNGTVVAWSIFNGSTTTDINGGSLVPPASATNVIAISAGSYHYMALKADGTVVTWGYIPANPGLEAVPPGLTNVIQIAAGNHHCLALKSDGTVVAWGAPYAVGVMPGDRAVKAVTTYSDIYVLKADGTVAHLGGTVLPPGLTDIVDIDADPTGHALALKADGTVISWVGLTEVPATVGNITAVAAGGIDFLANTVNVALTSNHVIKAWGGVPATIPPDGRPNDHVLVDYPGITAIDASGGNIIALTTGGEVRTWTGGTLPAPAGLTGIVAVAIGEGHALVLKNDGTVFGWGTVTVPPGLSNVVKIAANSVNYAGSIPVNYNVALKADGTVVTFGGSFPPPTDLAGVFDISTSGYSSTALFVPPDPPTITRFCAPSGNPGTVVRIDGSGFLYVKEVRFNGVPASFTNDFNFITYATVPPGATTGAIALTSPYGQATMDGFVVPNGLSPIETWRVLNFGNPANAGNGADLADPEGDGVLNLLEYFMHTNPLRSDRTPSLIARRVVEVNADRYLEFSVRRYALAADVSVHYEFTLEPTQAWQPYGGPLIDVAVEPQAECQTELDVKRVLIPARSPHYYLRYYVTRP